MIKEFLFARRRKIAEKMVDAVIFATKKGAELTKFTTIDDRLAKYIANERETLVVLVEQFLAGKLK